jgi:hypothetical protein
VNYPQGSLPDGGTVPISSIIAPETCFMKQSLQITVCIKSVDYQPAPYRLRGGGSGEFRIHRMVGMLPCGRKSKAETAPCTCSQ